jgi:uncharacterized repeat protein (TIGR03803 family)
VLHAFAGGTDGAVPYAPLLEGKDKNFYGTTQGGGISDCSVIYSPNGCGTVFKVTRVAGESVLHAYAGFPTDGGVPVAGLVQATGGTLYGSTEQGEPNNPGNRVSGCGTIFSIKPNGTTATLYSFGSPADEWYYVNGCNPMGKLLQGGDGTFYGTTQNGSQNAWGNVFALALVPTVKLIAKAITTDVQKGSELLWASVHANSCSASGAWSGDEPVSGQLRVQPSATGSFAYTLTCAGPGGQASASVTVTVKR